MTSDFEGFAIPDFIHYIYFPILILAIKPLFSLLNVLNKGTTGTIFITSLVCRGPWLGIEPGTSRARSKHYTTRLSRRRSRAIEFTYFGIINGLMLSLWTEYEGDHVIKDSTFVLFNQGFIMIPNTRIGFGYLKHYRNYFLGLESSTLDVL